MQRLARRLADLSADFEDLGRLAGASAPHAQLGSPLAAASFQKLAEAWGRHPQMLADQQQALFARQSAVLQTLSMGAPDPAADADPRFSAAHWRDNPFYDFTRRAFLATSEWVQDLALNAPGLTDIERRRAAFFLRQAMAAASPSNVLMANPRALARMFDSSGASLQRGFAFLQEDLGAGGGRRGVVQSDPVAFELGVDLAATPGEIVLRNDLIELIRYHPTSATVWERPLLILPPWINKYYVLDLGPRNSLAAWLRDQGFTVYMASWRSADETTRDFGWNDYFRLGARAALDWVRSVHDQPVHVAGYCVGGALASMLAARLSEDRETGFASLTLLAAQTDFSDPGDLGLFVDRESLPGLERMIEAAGGVMPGEAMRDAFNLLRPEELIWRHVEDRYLLGEPPRPFDLLHWNADQTNLPGRLHLESLTRLYIENALARGAFEIEGRPVLLSAIDTPVFLHAARRDHISPFASVYRGVELFSGDVDFLLSDSGHIAGVVNPPAAGKYRYWVNPQRAASLDAWLAGATEHAGSWWPVWSDWLSRRSGNRVPPPAPAPDAPPAPGDHVRETLESIRARRQG
jgi:polyhydroxyalkanoate synthase subunit PhaC